VMCYFCQAAAAAAVVLPPPPWIQVQTGVRCDLFGIYNCDLTTPTGMSHVTSSRLLLSDCKTVFWKLLTDTSPPPPGVLCQWGNKTASHQQPITIYIYGTHHTFFLLIKWRKCCSFLRTLPVMSLVSLLLKH
jgi:hypothetical protein